MYEYPPERLGLSLPDRVEDSRGLHWHLCFPQDRATNSYREPTYLLTVKRDIASKLIISTSIQVGSFHFKILLTNTLGFTKSWKSLLLLFDNMNKSELYFLTLDVRVWNLIIQIRNKHYPLKHWCIRLTELSWGTGMIRIHV